MHSTVMLREGSRNEETGANGTMHFSAIIASMQGLTTRSNGQPATPSWVGQPSVRCLTPPDHRRGAYLMACNVIEHRSACIDATHLNNSYVLRCVLVGSQPVVCSYHAAGAPLGRRWQLRLQTHHRKFLLSCRRHTTAQQQQQQQHQICEQQHLRYRSACRQRRKVATCAGSAAPPVAGQGELLSRLAEGPDDSQPSGQPGSSAFGEPLLGCPEPLGATYLPEQASAAPTRSSAARLPCEETSMC